MHFDLILINFIFASISAGLIVLFSRYNYSNHPGTVRTVVFIASFGILNGVISSLLSASNFQPLLTLKPIIILGASIPLILFTLRLTWGKSIITFIVISIGLGVGDALNPFLIHLFFGPMSAQEISANTLTYLIGNINTVLTAGIFMFILSLFKDLLVLIKSTKEFIGIFIFTFVIFTANFGLKYFTNIYDNTSFLIILALTVLYTAYLLFNVTVLYRRQQMKEEMAQQEFYNKSLEGTLFSLRRFKHDWGNNLATINAMMAMNKYEESKSYLREIIDYNATNNNTMLYNIKNAGLFGIISSKQSLALDRGIRIEVSGIGEVNDIPRIKISEFCEIIGIFLDNAIEESVKLNEVVELTYTSNEDFLEISIKNKCESPIDMGQFGKSSSKGPNRGNGLKIVDHILGKYKHIENVRSFDKDEKVFEQLLIIGKGL